MIAVFYFAVLCLAWGSTWIAIKIGVMDAPPLTYAGTRFVAAGILVLGFQWLRGGRAAIAVAKADRWRLFGVSALVIAVCFGLIFWGERHVSAGLTAIVVQGLIPIALPLFAAITAVEPLTRARMVAAAIGVTGLAIVFAPTAATPGTTLGLVGLLAITAGTLAYCAGSVRSRAILSRHSAVSIAGWQSLIGGFLAILAAAFLEPNAITEIDRFFLPHVLAAWLWLVLVGSVVGFVLYIVLLKEWGASRVSVYAFVTPLVAIVLEAVILGEVVAPLEAGGAAVLFLAVWISLKPPAFLDKPLRPKAMVSADRQA
ncbi:MAG: EamA family transporter [Azospirillaceae bacterium]